MKTFICGLFSAMLLMVLSELSFSQVEIKGTGSTSATRTLVTKNSSSDTSMVILDNGNVGIDTTTPSQKLHVNGTIFSSSGGFMFPDGSILVTGRTPYFRVFTVSPSGGDFTTISAALTACGTTSPSKMYLIRVMPGSYTENVTCKKYVHLKGAGKYSCVINGQVTGEDSCVIEDFFIKGQIYCLNTSPTILHNIITNTTEGNLAGIHVKTTPGDTAMPWIKENEILDCQGWGIFCDNVATDAWIIANKIMRNHPGGILCQHSCPTISNNEILHNKNYGIYLMGADGTPSEPTISDNVIGFTGYQTGGIGVYMINFAEPRVISNDIYLNECGIWIDPGTQPSIIGNDINYNFEAGIRLYSSGASKPPVITGNHIHSNAHSGGNQPAGIWIQLINPVSAPIISHNVITNNSVNIQGLPDIDYSACPFPGPFPTISLNVFDIILRAGGGGGPGPATGLYNVTSVGAIINP